ncbi:MATE family efflux transporter [Chromobacterium violaceum]|uniref:hypothetical protein n=1 Tax=Chromobacterium violaceum TaxID=536 RepID=UPI001CE13E10|nr:hypothetical protein [Chromobacterium violaceum]
MVKSYRIFISNYLLVGVLALSTILSMPVVFRHLGATEWSYVAITISVQAFLGLLDFGMIQLIPRDIARETCNNSRKRIYNQYVFNYLTIPLIAFLGFMLFSNLLSMHWEVNKILYGFFGGVLYLLQSLNLAHYAFLNGLGAQLLANRIQSSNSVARVLGVLVSVMLVKARAETYIIASVIFYTIELFVNLFVVQRRIDGRSPFRVCVLVSGLVRYVIKNWKIMLGVSVGVLASNLDRLMLMPRVDLSSFGIYVLVLGFALNAMNLQYPLFKNLLADACSLDADKLKIQSKRVFKLNFLICVIPCVAAGFMARPILQMWSHNVELAISGAPVFMLILFAVAINSLHHLNYLKQLYWNEQHWIGLTHIASLICCIVYLSFKPELTIVDGGVSWLIANLVQFISGLLWSMNRYRRPITFSW